MFYIPRSTFSRLIDNLTEEELSKFAVTIAEKEYVDMALLLRGEFTLPTFLNILENWLRISSIPYKHERNNDSHNFIIQHDMGRNFSFLVKELYRYILEDILKTKSDFAITDNTLIFRFRE